MKVFRKAISLLLVAALMLTLSVAVFADGTAPHTITITNNDAAEAHEYTAYQIFTGDFSEPSTLSNVKWGNGVDADGLLAALKAEIPAFADCNNAPQVVKVLTEMESDSEALRAFAAVVDRFVTSPAGTGVATAETPAEIEVIGDGYYYVKDTSANLETDTYSDYILLVEGDVTVEAKDTTGVRSFKKVKDINDSTLEGSDWQDSADYDIGDPVPFKLTGTVASDYDKYESYKLIFHDVESNGLTFDHVVRVLVDGEEIEGGFEVVTDCTDGCTFEVRFANLKDIESVHGGSVVEVEYISVLNDDAVIGVPGNPNTMCMEYSNNPTDESSTGTTPWDKVIVFTYEIIVDKVDENGEPLPGAKFQVEKWVIDEENPEGHWVVVPQDQSGEGAGEDGRIVRINGKTVTEFVDANGELFYKISDKPNETSAETDIYLKASRVERLDPEDLAEGAGLPYYELRDGVLVQVAGNFAYTIRSVDRVYESDTTFVWKGIDDGHYRIIETETPPGFNTMEPIEFDVIAEHEEESENPQLISVNGDPFMPTEENMGILRAEIENKSGGELPHTGGIGTTLFYVLGGLLVLGAGVLLVVKKFSDAN